MAADPVEILLIEDRPEDAELAMIALKESNLLNSIHWVEDGEEALEYISNGKDTNSNFHLPDLILLDLKLPKISGLEVLKELKQGKNTKNIPVVILTTSKNEKDVDEAYDLGANSYIIKPVDFDKFKKTVQDIGMYWLLLNAPSKKSPDN